MLTALACAHANCSVTLVEKGPGTGAETTIPSIALHEGTISLLESIGVYPELSTHLFPVDSVRMRNEHRTLSVLELPTRHIPRLFVLQPGRFIHTLRELIERHPDISALYSTEVIGISPGSGTMRIRGATEEQISADLVILSDGEGSRMRHALHIGYRTRQYREAFFSADVPRHEQSPYPNRAEVMLHPEGTVIRVPVNHHIDRWLAQTGLHDQIDLSTLSSVEASRRIREPGGPMYEIVSRRCRESVDFTQSCSTELLRMESARSSELGWGRCLFVGDAAYRLPQISAHDLEHLCEDIAIIQARLPQLLSNPLHAGSILYTDRERALRKASRKARSLSLLVGLRGVSARVRNAIWWFLSDVL